MMKFTYSFLVLLAVFIAAVTADTHTSDTKFETYQADPREEDHEAGYYKNPKDQFEDLHNRLQSLTHHIATVQDQLGKLYMRVNELHWRDDENREENRKERVPRQVVEGMDRRLKQIEEKIMTENGFEELGRLVRDHHFSLMGSVHHAVATGAPRLGLLLLIVVAMQIAWAVTYVGYKAWRRGKRVHAHNKYL
ncbi:hypothetical protein FN846DRAFT_953039 [Sphaerosporella brunnea]|uniref:Emp24/gp25L/p24 family/GOLD-domain-containing protein n=1 Tax=Sphaerosporella brunnea TaxID=1250544 RepID=A0A5J5EVN4_9PEZI|nr:hypothetical protein FN846DRAFT_953039 [Sphaerosporella brunnea]